MRILIVEDEKSLADEINHFLVIDGFKCDIANNGKIATELITINPYDIILLDIGLPDINGLELIKQINQFNKQASLIIITARGELNDKIKGFELGADDYLPKPFALVELLARIKAITRRKYGLNNSIITFGSFSLNPDAKTLSYNNTIINLTKKEYDLLYYLLLNKNRILDRMQLTEHIWGDFFEDDYDSNYIDVHIKNIRKKINQYDNKSTWIKTIRGVGYVFNFDS